MNATLIADEDSFLDGEALIMETPELVASASGQALDPTPFVNISSTVACEARRNTVSSSTGKPLA